MGYHAARTLWPMQTETNPKQTVVTIYMDQIKGWLPSAIIGQYADGFCWLLAQKNDAEAEVRRERIDAMPQICIEQRCRVLRFWDAAIKDISDDPVYSLIS